MKSILTIGVAVAAMGFGAAQASDLAGLTIYGGTAGQKTAMVEEFSDSNDSFYKGFTVGSVYEFQALPVLAVKGDYTRVSGNLSIDGTPNDATYKSTQTYLALEAGYNFQVASDWKIRPFIDAGLMTTSRDVTGTPGGEISDDQHTLGFGTGFRVTWKHLSIGASVRGTKLDDDLTATTQLTAGYSF